MLKVDPSTFSFSLLVFDVCACRGVVGFYRKKKATGGENVAHAYESGNRREQQLEGRGGFGH